jgi:hypothetical protein
MKTRWTITKIELDTDKEPISATILDNLGYFWKWDKYAQYKQLKIVYDANFPDKHPVPEETDGYTAGTLEQALVTLSVNQFINLRVNQKKQYKDRPCPFCGGIELDMMVTEDGLRYYVMCLDCNAQGSPQPTDRTALLAWNKAGRWEA